MDMRRAFPFQQQAGSAASEDAGLPSSGQTGPARQSEGLGPQHWEEWRGRSGQNRGSLERREGTLNSRCCVFQGAFRRRTEEIPRLNARVAGRVENTVGGRVGERRLGGDVPGPAGLAWAVVGRGAVGTGNGWQAGRRYTFVT